MYDEEKAPLIANLLKHGAPPMSVLNARRLSAGFRRRWGDYRMDWGVYGARGNPEDRAYLRGVCRPGGTWIDPGEVAQMAEKLGVKPARMWRTPAPLRPR